MKNKKKRGYALAVTIILILIMTIAVTAAFTIIMRYMFWARDNLQGLQKANINFYNFVERININAFL